MRGRLIAAGIGCVGGGLVVFVACFLVWLLLGGGAWRSTVRIAEAELSAPDRLTLIVDSCQGAPQVSYARETGAEVGVRVVAFSTPFGGGTDCQEIVKVYLDSPLGGRIVIDAHSGSTVEVTAHPVGGLGGPPRRRVDRSLRWHCAGPI